jgi:hypothetical protein
MTVLYPRRRVESVLKPLSLNAVHRITWKAHVSAPLTVRPSKSRFCDGRSYAVLYGAHDFATAFAEVVVRDRFVQRDRRVVPLGELTERGWVELIPDNKRPLNVIDLRGTGCVALGAPTDAVHARNQAAGRALSRILYDEYPDIDGISYASRLTGGTCLAIFDRALDGLTVTRCGELEFHPELAEILRTHGISLER